MLHHQSLSYISEIIQIELISRYHNDLLVGHFGIKKSRKLVVRKYYWPTLCHNVKDYVKRCDICLALKTLWHKPFGDLQSLTVATYHWKNLLMDIVTGLPFSTAWKRYSYDLILVIVNWLTKLVHLKPVMITINAPGLAKIIIDVVVKHHGLSDSIVTNRALLFTSKFWLLLCYFLNIKRRRFTTFYLQIDIQTERQNSIIEA